MSKTQLGVLVTDNGQNNQVDISPTATCAEGVQINIYGRNNHVVIGEGTVISGGLIELRNHESAVYIGADCRLAGSFCERRSNTRPR